MNNQTIQDINNLLDANSQSPIVPYDYETTLQSMLQTELSQEVAALRTMLANNPANFAAAFKERCQWRAQSPDQTIPFEQQSNTATNTLYWQIAEQVLQPQTMQEMLAIVAPNTTQAVEVDVVFDAVEFQRLPAKERIKLLEPKLEIQETLENLSTPPTLAELSNYVFCGNLILNVTDIENFNFPLHLQLHTFLNAQHPELAQKVYTHNENLRTLASEIVSLEQQGVTSKDTMRRITPKEAIGYLREGLRKAESGGYAGPSAVPAVKIFFTYFNTLPLATQNRLLDLGLFEIKRDIERGFCVALTGGKCERFKSVIPNDLDLTTTPQNAQESLQELTKKYRQRNSGESILSTQKSGELVSGFPKTLIQKAVQSIPAVYFEDFLPFLISFPSSFYDTLFQGISYDKNTMYQTTVDAVARGYFNDDQKRSLAHALTVNYRQHFTNNLLSSMGSTSLMDWIKRANDGLFMSAALTSMDKTQFANAANTHKLLLEVPPHAEYIQAIINRFPEQDQLPAVKAMDNANNSLLHLVKHTPETLNYLLSLYPEEERLTAVLSFNANGQTPLGNCAGDAALIRTILQLLPEEHRLPAAKTVDNAGNSLLHLSVNDSEMIEELLMFYPEDEQFTAISALNSNHDSVLHLAANYPQALTIILGYYPIEQRLAALKATNIEGFSVLRNCDHNIASVLAILELIPEEQRMEVITNIYYTSHALLLNAINNALDIKTVFSLLPKEEQISVVTHTDNNGTYLVHNLANNPVTLEAILTPLTSEQRYNAMAAIDGNGNTLLHFAAAHPESLKVLIDLLEPEQQINLLALSNNSQETPLHLAASNNLSLNVLLNCYPTQEQKLAAVKKENQNLRSVLHFAELNLQSFKAVLELYPIDERINAILRIHQIGFRITDWPIHTLELIAIKLKAVPEQDRVQLTYLLHRLDTYTRRILMENTELFEPILTLIPIANRLDVIKEINEQTGSLLTTALDYPETLAIIFKLLPEADKLEAIKNKTWKNQSLLHRCALKPKSFAVILEQLPEDDRLTELSVLDVDNCSVLDLATRNIESIETILALVPEEQRLTLLRISGLSKPSILIKALGNLELLNGIVKVLANNAQEIPVTELLADDIDSMFESAITHDETFKTLLALYPIEQRLEVIRRLKTQGTSSLQIHMVQLTTVRRLFDLLSDEDQLAFTKELAREGRSILSSAALTDPTFYTTVFSLYPEEERFNQLTHDALVLSTLPATLFIAALEYLPIAQRVQAFVLYSETSLSMTSDNLIVLLNLIPEEHKRQITEMALQKNKTNLLVNSYMDYKNISSILEVFDEDRKFELITDFDEYHNSVLSKLLHFDNQTFRIVLNLLPENRKLEALLKTDDRGQNLLYRSYFDDGLKTTIYNSTGMHYLFNDLNNKVRTQDLNTLAIEDIKLLLIMMEYYPNDVRSIDIDQTLNQLNARFDQPQTNEEFYLKMDINLAIIGRKRQHFKRLFDSTGGSKALNTTIKLYDNLLTNKYQLEQGQIDLNVFKANAKTAIDDAREVLGSHRGAKGFLEFLLHFTLFILGAGIFYLAAKNYYPGFFAIKTDSEQKLDEMQRGIAVAAF